MPNNKMRKPSSMSLCDMRDMPDEFLEKADRFIDEATDLLAPLVDKYTGSIAINAITEVHAVVLALVIQDNPDMLRQIAALHGITLQQKTEKLIEIFEKIKEDAENE